MILYVVQLVNGQKQSTVREGQWSQCKEMKKKHGCHRWSITRNHIVLFKKIVIWSDFKSNQKTSN